MAVPSYEVRSSARRTRTMTAFREDGRLVVVVPAHMSRADRDRLVPPLVDKLLAKEASQTAPRGDAALTDRARALFRRYLTPVVGAEPPPLGVRWVDNQSTRWGSCTIGSGEIRITDRLRQAPDYVVDHVLLHEVTHLVERNHTARFWELVRAYPDFDRARGFLDGLEFSRAHGVR